MIAEDKPLSRCTCSAVRMISRHISQVYDQALAPAGLRSGQYSLLRVLSHIGPLGVQQLGEYMMLDRTTVGRNLRPLEREGLVSIAVDRKDRRGRVLTITEQGRQRLRAADTCWEVAQDRLEQRFGSDPTWQLHKSFASILALDLSAEI